MAFLHPFVAVSGGFGVCTVFINKQTATNGYLPPYSKIMQQRLPAGKQRGAVFGTENRLLVNYVGDACELPAAGFMNSVSLERMTTGNRNRGVKLIHYRDWAAS